MKNIDEAFVKLDILCGEVRAITDAVDALFAALDDCDKIAKAMPKLRGH